VKHKNFYLPNPKKIKATAKNEGRRIRKEYRRYAIKFGAFILISSLMLFTIKFGALPIYVFAPKNTLPHEMAFNKGSQTQQPAG
jgi:hypothetical protein